MFFVSRSGHFLIPDLIFNGRDSSLHRHVYTAYRMCSEAVTMTLADGVFVDSIRRTPATSGYDFSTRKIAPLIGTAPASSESVCCVRCSLGGCL